jgi:hypothetical protein
MIGCLKIERREVKCKRGDPVLKIHGFAAGFASRLSGKDYAGTPSIASDIFLLNKSVHDNRQVLMKRVASIRAGTSPVNSLDWWI